LLEKIFSLFRIKDRIGPGSVAYAIFRPCRRCVYQKSKEKILIVSERDLKAKIIIDPVNRKVYARRGECLGIDRCQKCFEAINNQKDLPCKWIKI